MEIMVSCYGIYIHSRCFLYPINVNIVTSAFFLVSSQRSRLKTLRPVVVNIICKLKLTQYFIAVILTTSLSLHRMTLLC